MKTIQLLPIALIALAFSLSSAKADDAQLLKKLEREIQKEIIVAENAEGDSDLFEDDEDLFAEDEETTPSQESEAAEPTEEQSASTDSEPAEEEPAETQEEEQSEPVAEATPPPAPKPEPKKVVEKKSPPQKKMAHNPKGKKRTPASFKQGFKKLSKSCGLHESANLSSNVVLTSDKGKKLWLERHNDNWYKAYHKGGHGYFSADCF